MTPARRPRPTKKPARASKPSARAKRTRIEVRLPARQTSRLRAATLTSAAHAALAAANVRRSVGLTIVVGGDALLRRLNHDFLNIDAPTDVLSFPTQDPDAPDGYLGDVIISLARAKAQAKAGGHPLVDEVRLLVIHGVLHLLGYDHATPAQQKRMWARQTRALARAGASITGPVG